MSHGPLERVGDLRALAFLTLQICTKPGQIVSDYIVGIYICFCKKFKLFLDISPLFSRKLVFIRYKIPFDRLLCFFRAPFFLTSSMGQNVRSPSQKYVQSCPCRTEFLDHAARPLGEVEHLPFSQDFCYKI